MYLNQFSVRIPEGTESGGYVELDHNTQYTLVLRNSHNVRCDAKVEIDGKHVGTWRIHANSNLRLERPAHDDGRFTFYKLGTPEAEAAQVSRHDPNTGLVKVMFTPEKRQKQTHDSMPVSATTSTFRAKNLSSTPTTRSAGGTGLSGKSGQQFHTVGGLDYDYSRQTVIHLRLVAKNGDEPRPLTSYSSPVPPPVH